MTISTNLVYLCVGFAPVHNHTRPQDYNTLASAKIIKYLLENIITSISGLGLLAHPEKQSTSSLQIFLEGSLLQLVALFLFVGKTVPMSIVCLNRGAHVVS